MNKIWHENFPTKNGNLNIYNEQSAEEGCSKQLHNEDCVFVFKFYSLFIYFLVQSQRWPLLIFIMPLLFLRQNRKRSYCWCVAWRSEQRPCGGTKTKRLPLLPAARRQGGQPSRLCRTLRCRAPNPAGTASQTAASPTWLENTYKN